MNVGKLAGWVANSVDPEQMPRRLIWVFTVCSSLSFRIRWVSTVIWLNQTPSEKKRKNLELPFYSPIRCFCFLTESSDTLQRICERTAKAVLEQISLNIFNFINSTCDIHINISNKGGIRTKARVLIEFFSQTCNNVDIMAITCFTTNETK